MVRTLGIPRFVVLSYGQGKYADQDFAKHKTQVGSSLITVALQSLQTSIE